MSSEQESPARYCVACGNPYPASELQRGKQGATCEGCLEESPNLVPPPPPEDPFKAAKTSLIWATVATALASAVSWRVTPNHVHLSIGSDPLAGRGFDVAGLFLGPIAMVICIVAAYVAARATSPDSGPHAASFGKTKAIYFFAAAALFLWSLWQFINSMP